ncbi:beta-glucosidase 12 isoform X1 [Coffea arabica]|uniref:Beta-glucosidase 12 isoform X1 n=1 Tax=Coffea arabica TaxID=13443 RepID=A0A6P6UCR7_COFAR|nr:beta-glucosidase 12-like isoform X1 [Coffea arabica]
MKLIKAVLCSERRNTKTKSEMQNQAYFFLVLLSLTHSLFASSNDAKCQCDEAKINRGGFPENFLWGAGTSAYQVEGAYNEGGKGPSLWDNFTHAYPEKIVDQSNGDIAVNSYHYFEEDIKIAKDLGLDAYRFSISWSRILPRGNRNGGVNQEGIDYYNNIINDLLANGIQPFVTMFHFNMPQALEDAYGGFLSFRIVADFRDFADILFSKFGDRVKYWITLNEPWTFSNHGYAIGRFAPGRCSEWQQINCTGGNSGTEPYIVTHNQLLAHAAVVHLYRTKYQIWQKGKIGIALAAIWFEPYNSTDENLMATDRALDFMLGWFMQPLTSGQYPQSMRVRAGNRLPNFSNTERDLLIQSFDFIGLNYYTSRYVLDKPNSSSMSYINDSEVDIVAERDNKPIGEVSVIGSWLHIYPKGLRELLNYMKMKYNNPTIYITENGLNEARNDSMTILEAIKDDIRKDYIHDHLCCILQAIEQFEVTVSGYFVWSLMDNFEWAFGYSIRFGIHFVDYNDELFTRYPKHSALWYKSILVKKIKIAQSIVSNDAKKDRQKYVPSNVFYHE